MSFKFLAQYPFKPPMIRFKTKIYHPSVSENVAVKITEIINWKPQTKTYEVIRF